MDFKAKLHTEIDDELGRLAGIEVGTNEYKTTVDGLTKLMDRAIEIHKVEVAQEEKAVSQKFENALKKQQVEFDQRTRQTELDCKLKQMRTDGTVRTQQMKDDANDRLVKNCIAAAGIAIPAMITIWGTLKSLRFEKDGTVTTIVGRGFINKLLPKK